LPILKSFPRLRCRLLIANQGSYLPNFALKFLVFTRGPILGHQMHLSLQLLKLFFEFGVLFVRLLLDELILELGIAAL